MTGGKKGNNILLDMNMSKGFNNTGKTSGLRGRANRSPDNEDNVLIDDNSSNGSKKSNPSVGGRRSNSDVTAKNIADTEVQDNAVVSPKPPSTLENSGITETQPPSSSIPNSSEVSNFASNQQNHVDNVGKASSYNQTGLSNCKQNSPSTNYSSKIHHTCRYWNNNNRRNSYYNNRKDSNYSR